MRASKRFTWPHITEGYPHLATKFSAILLVGLVFIWTFAAGTFAQSTSSLEKERTAGLIKMLSGDPDPKSRASAAQLLAQRDDRRSIKPLMIAVGDLHEAVGVQAVLALGQLRARIAVPLLIETMKTGFEAGKRSAAAFALGIIQDRRAVEPLIERMKTADTQLRQNIIVSLGRLGDPRAVEPLLNLPHDDGHEGCAPIALALGQVRSRVPADKLFEWLNGEHADVCPNAAVALVLIGGRRQVTPLIGVLKNKNPISRRSAAFALGTLRDRRAVLPLIEALNDLDKRVRLNAIASLASLKDERAIDPLNKLAKSDSESDVREQAENALTRLRSQLRT
jgi:HEAT repeat protein